LLNPDYPFSISLGWLLTVLLGKIQGETIAKTNKTNTNINADMFYNLFKYTFSFEVSKIALPDCYPIKKY